MSDIFVSKDDKINIPFVFGKSKDGQIVAASNKEELYQFNDDIDPQTVEYHEAYFKRPSFSDIVDINESSGNFTTQDGASISFNPMGMRANRIKKLIKSWTIKDENGNEVDPTEERIDSLNPNIAFVIGLQLDIAVGSM